MPFTCLVKADFLRTVLKGLEGISDTVVINVTEGRGMWGWTQDSSTVALCDYTISSEAFEVFEFYKTTKTQIWWKLKPSQFLKCIAGAEFVELYSNDNPSFLGISYSCDQDCVGGGNVANGKLGLEKITDEEKERMGGNQDLHENSLVIKSKTFQNLVSQLAAQAANVRLVCSPQIFELQVNDSNTGIKMNTGIPHLSLTKLSASVAAVQAMQNGTADVSMMQEEQLDAAKLVAALEEDWVDLTNIKMEFNQRFPLKFLNIFASIAQNFSTAQFFIAQNSTLVIRYNLGDNQQNGYISFFISPMRSDDGKEQGGA